MERVKERERGREKAHVHYQFITQPSATFPLGPRSRFPSFLRSSTPPSSSSWSARQQRDRGVKWSGQEKARWCIRQSERKRKNDERIREKEKKRPWPAQLNDGQFGAIGSRGSYSLAASIHISLPLRHSQPWCMPRMQPAIYARGQERRARVASVAAMTVGQDKPTSFKWDDAHYTGGILIGDIRPSGRSASYLFDAISRVGESHVACSQVELSVGARSVEYYWSRTCSSDIII